MKAFLQQAGSRANMAKTALLFAQEEVLFNSRERKPVDGTSIEVQYAPSDEHHRECLAVPAVEGTALNGEPEC
jgi:hypothetical protein